ncbi:MAG: cell division protein ZapE [Nevskiales bacterium]
MTADQPAAPRARYDADLRSERISADSAQALAVDALQGVYADLLAKPPKKRLGKYRWPPVTGLYLWGGVGRGKTYLMDAFYEALPFTRKYRTHFHRFMQEVHVRRKNHQDQEDPLALIAEEFAQQARVLCFDEFFVSDIADAMILGRLNECLFKQGVTLIATSNTPPDELYQDGLQRQNFLPAIAKLKQHCKVLKVDGGVDYRLRVLEQAEIYHSPLDEAAERNLADYFSRIAPEPGRVDGKLELHGRKIAARRLSEGVAWFDFEALCKGPRSAADYTELARFYHTVLLSRVPQLAATLENETRRFITLVDEFYDRGVKLILSAAVPQASLYTGELLKFEFQRTQSRLIEMCSHDYLARPHLP